MLRLILFPIAAAIVFLLFFWFYRPVCSIPPHVVELSAYTFKDWKLPEVSSVSLKFDFEDVFVAEHKKASQDFSNLVENLNISVIRGSKEYLLIEGFFVEKGKSFGGLTFLGLKDGEVLIEVAGKVYKKHF